MGMLCHQRNSERVAVIRRCVGAFVAVCLAGGCGSSADVPSASAGTVTEATRSAESARLRVAVTSRSGAFTSIVSEGVIDFRTGDSEFTTSLVGVNPAEQRIDRTVSGELFLGTTRPDSSGATWVRILPSSDGTDSVRPMGWVDLTSILDELGNSTAELTRTGEGEVRGDETVIYDFELQVDSGLAALTMLAAGTPATTTIDMDREGRLRRLVVEPHDVGVTPGVAGHGPAVIPDRVELELWDFGIDVDVEKPAPESVVDLDDPRAPELLAQLFGVSDLEPPDRVDLPAMDPPELAEPFSEIDHGTWENVSWRVWEASTADDGVCYAVELEPPAMRNGGANGQLDLPGAIAHNGHSASCGARADWFDRGQPLQLLGDWSESADYWHIIGTAAPNISSLSVELDNGGTIDVPVEPTSHVFVLFSREPLSVRLVVPDAGDAASIRCLPDMTDGYGITDLSCSGSVSG